MKTTCKNCKKNYDDSEVARIYGMESMPYVKGYCSAKCYTQSVPPKKETEHPYDLQEKGKLYDALKQRNDELVEALEEVSPLIDGLINRTPTGKKRNELCDMNIKVKQALKNNEND